MNSPVVSLHRMLKHDQLNAALRLLGEAFDSKQHQLNLSRYFANADASGTHAYLTVTCNSKLIAFAIIDWRDGLLLGSSERFATCASVCVAPEYRRKGISYVLLEGICRGAQEGGASYLYLQGIDGFYGRFNFYPMLSKSKLMFSVNTLKELDDVQVVSFINDHIAGASEIYDSLTKYFFCKSYRPYSKWSELLFNARDTWYFFDPKAVFFRNKLIGYFCSDPEDAGRIREAVYLSDDKSVDAFMAGLRMHALACKLDFIEIMTWYRSPLYFWATKHSNCQFIQNIKSDGSQLMKVLDFDKLFDLLKLRLCPSLGDIRLLREGGKILVERRLDSVFLLLFKIEERFLPGFITGYYRSSSIVCDLSPGIGVYEIEKSLSAWDATFVFQGDNL